MTYLIETSVKNTEPREDKKYLPQPQKKERQDIS